MEKDFLDNSFLFVNYTDCTSYILIKNAGIEKAISFDEHFGQFGIEILPLESS